VPGGASFRRRHLILGQIPGVISEALHPEKTLQIREPVKSSIRTLFSARGSVFLKRVAGEGQTHPQFGRRIELFAIQVLLRADLARSVYAASAIPTRSSHSNKPRLQTVLLDLRVGLAAALYDDGYHFITINPDGCHEKQTTIRSPIPVFLQL
jgi:hypothetical protein